MIQEPTLKISTSTATAERHILSPYSEPLDYETPKTKRLPIGGWHSNASQELDRRRIVLNSHEIKNSTGLTNYKITEDIQRDIKKENWYSKAFIKIENFQNLSKNWNSYGAEAPNSTSIHWAQKVIDVLHKFNFPPTGIVPSAEEGIGIYFSKGKLYADMECFNTGEILAVISDSKTEPTVWEVCEGEIPEAVERIRGFISR